MATTTATITLASSDIADNALSISNTSTLYTAGTNTGITETTGLGRKKFATTGNVVLLDGGLTSGIAADVTDYVLIDINSEEIGRLYAGDWLFMPWDCDLTHATADSSIEIEAVGHETIIEYALFHNGETLPTAGD